MAYQIKLTSKEVDLLILGLRHNKNEWQGENRREAKELRSRLNNLEDTTQDKQEERLCKDCGETEYSYPHGECDNSSCEDYGGMA